jgi:CubicO group peptidase (beta-lactamase class C family)
MFRPAPGHLDAVTRWFEDNFRSRGELGASVSIWQSGVEILSLAHGHADRSQSRPWTTETLAPVWSATKGPAAVCALMAMEEASLPIDSLVAEIWPEFASGGKENLSFAHLFSHTAGLCALDERVSILDYEAVIQALEHQQPLWEPGSKQGYHARTFGFLMDEIVRRVIGAVSLGEYFREAIGSPLGLDFWIGLPSAQHGRVATVYPGKIGIADGNRPFLKAFSTSGSLTQRTFSSPLGLNAVQDFNQPETWQQGFASMGGVGSASGLGKFYAMLAQGGVWGGRQILPADVIRLLSGTLSEQEDLVLCTPIAFGAGVMKDPLQTDPALPPGKHRRHYGPSLQAFGHPGAGGCLAFADPENQISFAYTMNQMETGALPGPKSIGLIDRLYGLES